MRRQEGLAPVEVGDGAGDAKYSIVRPRREAELLHGAAKRRTSREPIRAPPPSFTGHLRREVLVAHPWHLDMDVDPIEKRPGDASDIALYLGKRADTPIFAVIAAGTPLRCLLPVYGSEPRNPLIRLIPGNLRQ